MVKNDELSEPATRHARLRRLFFLAIGLEEEGRGIFVREACGDDSELREELESLLEHHRSTDLEEIIRGRS